MDTILAAPVIHLECIDGIDDHFKIELAPGEKKVFGGFDDELITGLKELEKQGGVIIVINDNGILKIDASDCAVPVKINGQIISQANLRTKDILKIGNTIWKTMNITEELQVLDDSEKSSISKGFSNILGLDELRDFNFKSLFSEVFKKHSLAETE